MDRIFYEKARCLKDFFFFLLSWTGNWVFNYFSDGADFRTLDRHRLSPIYLPT